MKNVSLCAPLILTPLLSCAQPSVSSVAPPFDAVMSLVNVIPAELICLFRCG
jgi:hypothetical protein